MKTRLLTSVYFMIVLVLAFISRIFTPYVFDVIIGALAIMGAVEVGRVFERTRLYNNIYLIGSFPAVLYVGFVFAFTNKWAWEYYLLLVLCLMFVYFLVTFLTTIIFKKFTMREMSKYQSADHIAIYALKKAINTSVIVVYPTLLFATMFILNHFNSLSIGATVTNVPFDYYVLLTVFFVTISTDSLAMIIGSLLKGPKLCPRISPKKTISGAVGGLAGGVLAAFVIYWLFSINPQFVLAFDKVASLWTVAIFGFVGSIISQFGDLFASYLKRRARVKDYGTIFPGHGGVMDRVDGLIFNSAFMLICLLILF